MIVRTARISYRGRDRFDCTRLTGAPIFAPTWAILRPMLAARLAAADKGDPRIEAEAWERYRAQYLDQMRASYRNHPDAWTELIRRETVTLVCYCKDAEHCHRRLLAEILVKLGAIYEGEVQR